MPLFSHTFSTRTLAASAAAALLLVAAPALAQDEFQSVRPLGMGNAFVGGGNSNGALYRNPAGIISAGVYSLEAGYQRSANLNSFGTSIVDSKTNPQIAMGIGYAYSFGDGPTRIDDDDIARHDLRGAIAFPLVPQRVALGVGVHYSRFFAGFGPPPEDSEETRGPQIIDGGFSMDVGLMANLGRVFNIGIAAQRLLQPDGYPLGRAYAGGFGVFLGGAHFEVGWRGEERLRDGEFGNGVNVGLEYTIVTIPIRVGYDLDPRTEGNYISAGLGYRSDHAGADFGFRQNLSEGQSNDRMIGVSLSGYF